MAVTQDPPITLVFKIVLIAVLLSLLAFAGDYTRLTNWGWRRNPIGRMLIAITGLLALAITPSIMSLFFRFNRLTSHVAAWIDIALFAAVAVAMTGLTIVFENVHREQNGTDGHSPPKETPQAASPARCMYQAGSVPFSRILMVAACALFVLAALSAGGGPVAGAPAWAWAFGAGAAIALAWAVP